MARAQASQHARKPDLSRLAKIHLKLVIVVARKNGLTIRATFTMGSSRPLDAIDLRVASRLRHRRRELRLDPRMLDIVIGEPAGTVERFEAAERRLTAAHLFRLGQALNVDIPYFFVEDAREGAAQDASERADEVEDPPQAAPQMITEGEHLARVFRRLPNQSLRRLVISLIKSIAARDHGRE
jgi:transcriptional regulator with XRE-family HTH domain